MYEHVPDVPRDAEPDPHWAELRGGATLPTSYLPPAMAGDRPGWVRASVWVLVAVFLTATAGGVCLTYGPDLPLIG